MSDYKCFLVFLVFLVGCVSQQPVSEELPVVEEVLVQCWDNSTADSLEECPSQEIVEVKIEEAPAPKILEKTLMQELLQKAPADYFYYDGLDGIIVSGNKRSTGEYNEYWNAYSRIMFWNTETKTIYILAPRHVQEFWWLEKQGINQTAGNRSTRMLPAFFEVKLAGNEDVDENLMPPEFNKYWFDAKEGELVRIVRPFYSKGPVDWMREYELDVPVEIDNTEMLLSNVGGNARSNLSITYKNKGKSAPFVIFRFDNILGVPLFIDEVDESGKLLKRNSFEIGVDYISQHKRVKVSENLVSLPEGSIVISVKDYEKYSED